jgi:uncharacterized damage-inducible protein DinB
MDEDLLQAKPSEDGWTLAFHLCHIHETRAYWLKHTSGADPKLADLYHQEGEDWIPSNDLAHIRQQLKASERAVSDWLANSLGNEGAAGPYDHPVFYLQHMMWHEGWHAGLLMLGLRLAGHEPSEEWEDPNLWGNWRNYG